MTIKSVQLMTVAEIPLDWRRGIARAAPPSLFGQGEYAATDILSIWTGDTIGV